MEIKGESIKSDNPSVYIHNDIICTIDIAALGLLMLIPSVTNSEHKCLYREFRLLCKTKSDFSDYLYKKNLKTLCDMNYISISDDNKVIELLIPSLIFLK